MAGAGFGEAAGSLPGSSEAPWTYVEGHVSIELRPVGGEAAVTFLQPNTRYELHYTGAEYPVEGYTLSVCDPGDTGGIKSASSASQGVWSETELFEFVDNVVVYESAGAQCQASDLVMDDLALGATGQGAPGYVCDVTTESSGQLHLTFVAYSTDEAGRTTSQVNGQLTLLVGLAP